MQNQDKWKYNGLMNSGGVGGAGGLQVNQSSKMGHSPQVQQMMHHQYQLQQQQMHMQQHPQQSHHHMHPMGTNVSGMANNNQMGMNHMGNAGQQQQQQQQQSSQQQQQQQQAMSNYSMNSATGQPLQMGPMQGGLYDHHHQGMNGMGGQLPNPMAAGTPKVNEQLVYMGGGQHMNVMPPMNRNAMGVSRQITMHQVTVAGIGYGGLERTTGSVETDNVQLEVVWRESDWFFV